MDLISHSAEHHFITKLEALKANPTGWLCQYFSLSKMLDHKTLAADISMISNRMQEARHKRDHFIQDLQSRVSASHGFIYSFEDLDVLFMAQVETTEQKAAFTNSFHHLAKGLPKKYSDMGALALQMKTYQTLADQKLLTVTRQKAYQGMTDTAKISSIAARRKRRDNPLIMIVEDDRFTAHYASTILAGEYDVLICRTGEDAILSYIDNAPDIVFMDIHLPGLSGHEAVEAIYAIDKEAFIVMLSVDSVRDNIVRASKNGARKFLKKPYSRERIIDSIHTSPHVRSLMRSTSVGHTTLIS